MVQIPSWAANWFTASQEIPRISPNANVHYRTHKCLPPVYPGPAQSSPHTHIPHPGGTFSKVLNFLYMTICLVILNVYWIAVNMVFFKSKSPITVVSYLDFISPVVCSQHQVDARYFDLSNTFDLVHYTFFYIRSVRTSCLMLSSFGWIVT